MTNCLLILSFMVWYLAAETAVAASGTCMYQQYAPKPELSSSNDRYEFWIGICLESNAPGIEECQECIDKVWCNEEASCWDSKLGKLAPCTEVSYQDNGPFPQYPKCPGAPAPAPVTFDTAQEDTKCLKEAQTTGQWYELGKRLTQETCLKACSQWKSCEHVSFEPSTVECDYLGHGECAPSEKKGTCTAFTSCSSTQIDAGTVTWKKLKVVVPSTPAPPSVPAPAPVSLKLVREGKQCHKDFATTGLDAYLGQEVTQEFCLDLCALSESCIFVSWMGQTGACRSYSSCGKKQKADSHTKTWKKVQGSNSECSDVNNQKWCEMKKKNGKCNKSFVAKKCEYTCGSCDGRRLRFEALDFV